jgi:hypothetical protein
MILNAWQCSPGNRFILLSTALLLASGFASRADGPIEPAENTSAPAPVPAEAPRSRPAKVEAFALIGTGSYPGGAVACFDGNHAAFKTSAHAGEKIGDCTVAAVAFDHVKLRAGTREFDLPMAMQLRRENNGQWQLLALTERFTPADQPFTREFKPAPMVGFAPRPPEDRAPSKSERGLSEKQLRKLDGPSDDERQSGKGSKSGKSSKRERAAEAGFIKQVEKAVRADDKAIQRQQ